MNVVYKIAKTNQAVLKTWLRRRELWCGKFAAGRKRSGNLFALEKIVM